MNIDIPKQPGYAVTCYTNNQAPTDGQVIWFGANGVSAAGTGFGLPIVKAGTVVAASIRVVVSGTLGTTETATAVVRHNNTTDSTISAAVVFNAAINATLNSGVLSQAVVLGDYIEIKVTHPTFATNPTGVYYQVGVYIST